MELIADGLLIATTLTAAIYCAVLSRRLRRLSSTEDGIGGQITALNGAVQETRQAVSAMQDRIAALRGHSNATSERVRREMAEAHRLNEALAETSARARRLLDGLYAAETVTTPEPPPRAGPPLEPAASGAESGAMAPGENAGRHRPQPAAPGESTAPDQGADTAPLMLREPMASGAEEAASASDPSFDPLEAEEEDYRKVAAASSVPGAAAESYPLGDEGDDDTGKAALAQERDAEDPAAQREAPEGDSAESELVVSGPDPAAAAAFASMLDTLRPDTGTAGQDDEPVETTPTAERHQPPEGSDEVIALHEAQERGKPPAPPEQPAPPRSAPPQQEALRVKRFGFAQ
ncbi:MAG: hypothetical protein AAFN17_10620 [Pseudomonadota bacterium]